MKYLLILIIILTSCSAPKRLERLQKNHSYLFERKTDTIKVEIKDTVYFDRVQKDTLFHVDFDTVFIQNERLKIQLIRENDTIYVDGVCDGDTVYIDKIIYIPYNRFTPPEIKEDNSILKWLVALAIVALILFAFLILKFKK